MADILSIILLVASGVFKGLSDLHEEGVLLPKKSNSWVNKWRRDSYGNLVPNDKPLFYYLWTYCPPYKERFIYSATLFSALTDPWHAYQSLSKWSILFAVYFYEQKFVFPFDILYLWGAFTLGFNVVYHGTKE
jgi:hypothetical protein